MALSYEVTAEWNASKQVYVAQNPVNQYHWFSEDGDEWLNEDGEPVTHEAFAHSTITLAGGPRDGQKVA